MGRRTKENLDRERMEKAERIPGARELGVRDSLENRPAGLDWPVELAFLPMEPAPVRTMGNKGL